MLLKFVIGKHCFNTLNRYPLIDMKVDLLNNNKTCSIGDEVNVNVLLERDHEEGTTLTPVHSLYFPVVRINL